LTAVELVESSELFHKEFKIPCIPGTNNEHFYTALIWHIVADLHQEISHEWLDSYKIYLSRCENERLPGVYYRIPDKSGGSLSHDEILGIASMSGDGSKAILSELYKTDGIYPTDGGSLLDSRNFFRFIFLEPFLRCCAYWDLSLISQAKWSLHVLFDSMSQKRDSVDPDAVLKIWLMSRNMVAFPMCNIAYTFWRYMMKKQGITLNDIFKNHYLSDKPTLQILTEGKDF
jgi:hypothetical protein